MSEARNRSIDQDTLEHLRNLLPDPQGAILHQQVHLVGETGAIITRAERVRPNEGTVLLRGIADDVQFESDLFFTFDRTDEYGEKSLPT
jgi:hypothetical protein